MAPHHKHTLDSRCSQETCDAKKEFVVISPLKKDDDALTLHWTYEVNFVENKDLRCALTLLGTIVCVLMHAPGAATLCSSAQRIRSLALGVRQVSCPH